VNFQPWNGDLYWYAAWIANSLDQNQNYEETCCCSTDHMVICHSQDGDFPFHMNSNYYCFEVFHGQTHHIGVLFFADHQNEALNFHC